MGRADAHCPNFLKGFVGMNIYRKYFNRYRVPFFMAVICVTLEAFCDLLSPTLMSHIINAGIDQHRLTRVYYWGSFMLLVTLIGAGFAVSRNLLASRVSQRMGADLRLDLFEKILRFSEESADQIESGSLITRMTNDTSQVVQFVNGIMRIFLKAPITCVGSIVLASLLNLRLSVIIYCIVAVVAFLIFISMKLSYPRFYKLQRAMDQVNSVVQEYLIGVRLVKAFGTYDKEEEKFRAANTNLMAMGISSQIIITFIAPLMTLTVGAGTVIAIYSGSRMFLAGTAKPGDIAAFTIYMAQILTSLIMITNIFNTFVRTKASTARIREVFECENDFVGNGELVKLGGAVEFREVTFAYPKGSGVPALKRLSFSVESGQSLAIIGPTGSGKSTIAWLLLRFYDVNSGEIRIHDHDIREFGIDTVRNSVAIVPQRPMLFSGTVSQNILWGDSSAEAENIKRVSALAQADFIEGMTMGYDSLLGSGGVNISGGQKQRISIARGLIKNAPILILDDATSALDAVTEAKVRENLVKGNPGQTIITITQRCGTAMFADRILVLDNGSRAGFGTHDQLMEECEVYREIYQSQMESGREV